MPYPNDLDVPACFELAALGYDVHDFLHSICEAEITTDDKSLQHKAIATARRVLNAVSIMTDTSLGDADLLSFNIAAYSFTQHRGSGDINAAMMETARQAWDYALSNARLSQHTSLHQLTRKYSKIADLHVDTRSLN